MDVYCWLTRTFYRCHDRNESTTFPYKEKTIFLIWTVKNYQKRIPRALFLGVDIYQDHGGILQV